MVKKEISMRQQTWALLCKNFLRKWRLKRESLLEWTIALLLGLSLCIPGAFNAVPFPEQPPHILGRVDEFNDSDLMVIYTPVTDRTQSIMDKIALVTFMKGIKIIGAPNEEAMDTMPGEALSQTVGIVFNGTSSYQLKFDWGYRIPAIKEHLEYSEHCEDLQDEIYCHLTMYWQKGFVALQAAINAAIIEVTTNHSVMENLMSVIGINMRTLPFFTKGPVVNEWVIIVSIISFSPFVYVASLTITRERKQLKKLMVVMGLRESAFWLSWGLMYAGFFFIMSTLMALIITYIQIVVITGFTVIFILFILYGLSLITLVFLLSVLIKKPILTALAGFFFMVFWGCLGFTALYKQLSSPLQWVLGLFSPFAFTAGLSQITDMNYYLSGIIFPDPSGESYRMIATYFILVFDTLLYLILALYLEQVLPDKDGYRQSPLFFLKSSFWSKHQNTHHEVFENDINPEHLSEDSFEPVPPEFHGKESIRIRNIKKEYNGKAGKIEALQGIFLDIYEGQITAILGHSGAGKSTLLNILSGLSVSTEGSATIYNTNLSQRTNMEEIRKNIGFCPQGNIQFDFLTVRENLRLFAKIRGIQAKEVEEEVKRIIMELDIQNIQNVNAKELSGGQKRKLTFGIALLGDPQVLLLDEPTAGLDPFSRHRVWSLLKERKSDHVVLFSTQFMDEADVLAERKVFLSNGKLKCAGSSLFLKRKWGIGYYLSLHRNEMCDPQRITSLVKQHIPEAKLRAESEEKLVYTLPLDRTSKFSGLYSDLDQCSDQGIISYGVSMTTLTEAFLNLEGKSTIDEPDFGIWKQEKLDVTRETENKSEIQQALCSLPEMSKTVSDRTLWRRQVFAMARLRFLQLRRNRRALLSLLLLLLVAFIPATFEKVLLRMYYETDCWEFSPSMYFLSLEQPPKAPLTSLLIINNTGSNIEDFVHSLKHQNLVLEIDDFENRNGSDDPLYNGAIIVSGDKKDYTFSVACNTKRINCFPILIGIISNGLLGIFNSTEHIQTERNTFPYHILCFIPYLQSLILLFIIRCLEMKYGSETMRKDPVFRISPRKMEAHPNPEEPEEEDEDVQTERVNAANALSNSNADEKPVIIASCLQKEYKEKKSCFSKRKTKIAIRNVSFCVKKGEVLGLLGHNGAGKSTSIKVIMRATKPTAGKVVLQGSRASARPEEDYRLKFLGYCPQENCLWPNLTMSEHLELYATVKGLSKEDAALCISRLVDVFKLQDQLKVPVKTLSEGIKRKLCFVLSILGGPAVVLLDEPSTGMDPEGQQQMWQAIQTIVKNKEQGILLTTHYMTEAEAVCDRVVIMVSGRIRCIGSIQHLKSKFGKDYLLEIKVKEPTQVKLLHAEILKLFPQAARQERYGNVFASVTSLRSFQSSYHLALH
ncbi:PREDICTED: ATP-binding cassette sub-family A member 10-like [Chrysochloris asiatica]|uniref:ATP-binding cassette sub-family A member 10-like n=1 Tax=Chrysochloris asiatica TaxID=185453 RepID=A0A9B0SZ70_CHRAS|nr:PREDICTED: ATP-binding cassette sub-family A member 10-like [Chrysochloris asiatica]